MNKKGFTLVEVMVASGIFALIVVVVASIYVTVISSQRRTFAVQDALDSSRFALESMARSIRQSSVSSAGGSTLELTGHPDKGNITYILNNGRLEENGQPITADNVVVETLIFRPQGTGATDGEQPRITILMEVRSKNTKETEQHHVPIQTTITPRGLQLES